MRGARTSRPSPVPAIPAGSSRAARYVIRKLARPRVTPIEWYTSRTRVPIDQGSASAVVTAAGTARVQVGPQGLGTRWYPVMVGIASSTGAADVSTMQLFLGTASFNTLTGAQSYNGGGDSAGLNGVELYPGQYLIGVWSGAVPGAVVSLNVQGDMTALA